ncbi:HEXXH motif domain-containing protein [Amycolatopsis sp. NPDC059657]|uniref:HEXXH motif domain-containing protein n=1 Tax=Amycolatopsis sp. NPDC059657 TaxID=3346899 RepID=UPI00366AAB61
MLRNHRVSLASFDALAAGEGNAAIAGRLKQTHRSRQLALVRAVLDRASARAPGLGPLPALEAAWRLLSDAQQADPGAAEAVITNPQLGLWAAKALRRLGNTATSDTPLWADLGYLHLTATAAAIRAGLDFRARVPVSRGVVVLPTLGMAELPAARRWDIAEVHSARGRVLVRGAAGSVRLPPDPAGDGTGWHALRLLRVGDDTDPLEVWLDDLDPYRGFDEPLEPQRVSAEESAEWLTGLAAAWRLLTEHHPTLAGEISAGLTTLVPRPATGRLDSFSASHGDTFGCIVLSLPPDATGFAATLIHEFQHSKLGILLELLDLVDADTGGDRFYAPWRDDPRPLIGLLHGVFSYLGVTAFYRTHRTVATGADARLSHFEFAYRREQASEATAALTDVAELTPLGRRFVAIAAGRLARWQGEPVPEDLLAAARRANLDHRLTWRLRHLLADPAAVTELARAWLGNRRKPHLRIPAPALHTSTESGPGPAIRAELTRVRLGDPELFAVYRDSPELANSELPGATPADLALVDDARTTAAAEFRARVVAEPGDPGQWAGLALATANAALLSAPELVRAVHRAITELSGEAPDPVRLATWLA